MAFRITYDEILELIKKTLLRTDVARAIVRRAGARPGDGSAASGVTGKLPPGGSPWWALTKMSDEDFDVDWRPLGFGSRYLKDVDGGWVTESGPPCNMRILSWSRLRDSKLRSGVDNADRFGYAFDPYLTKARSPSGAIVDFWYERDPNWAFFGKWVELFDRTVMRWHADPTSYALGQWGVGSQTTSQKFPIDRAETAAKTEGRLIIYVTRAEWPYTIHLSWGPQTFPQEVTGPSATNVHYFFERTGTGRFVSDWLPIGILGVPEGVPGTIPQTDGTLAKAGRAINAFVRVAPTAVRAEPSNDPTLAVIPTAPWDYYQLQEGIGPLCIPFCEVEVRTTFTPSATYSVQDQYTPEQYRDIATWESMGYPPTGPTG